MLSRRMSEDVEVNRKEINITRVKKFLRQSNFDINTIFSIRDSHFYNSSLLSIAVENNDDELIEYLVSQNADINLQVSTQGPAIHVAIIMKNLRILKKLHKLGADINIQNEFGDTPLVVAIIQRQYKISKYLLENGADVNSTSSRFSDDDYHPLYIVAKHGTKEIVELLLDYNSDIDAKTSAGSTVLAEAAISGNIDVVKLLIKRGADINCITAPDGRTIIHEVITANLLTSVLEYFLSLDEPATDINIRTKSNMTLLHFSLLNSYRKINTLHLILDAGVDMEAVEEGFEDFGSKCCEEVLNMKINRVGVSNINKVNQ